MKEEKNVQCEIMTYDGSFDGIKIDRENLVKLEEIAKDKGLGIVETMDKAVKVKQKYLQAEIAKREKEEQEEQAAADKQMTIDDYVGAIFEDGELKRIAIDLDVLAEVEKLAKEKGRSITEVLAVACKNLNQKKAPESEEKSKEESEEQNEENDEYDSESQFEVLNLVLMALVKEIEKVRKIVATDDINDMFEMVMGEELVTVNDDILEAATNALRSFGRGCQKIAKLEEEYGQGSTDEEDS